MGIFREIVIWAHSECRSTFSLYREVVRQAGIPVAIALWKHGEADDVRKLRESQGQRDGEYSDLPTVSIGEDLARGRALLAAHCGPGTVHVFCVYQNSPVWRRLAVEAKATGARVVVYAEAPCPMCLGAVAALKRIYYRTLLPLRLRHIINAADLILCASGPSGVPGLCALGWPAGKIVPFGYASPVPSFARRGGAKSNAGQSGRLKILHSGKEEPYRGISTLERACKILEDAGVGFELVCTGGNFTLLELAGCLETCDMFVACGICEPWGIRVNDALHAGLPAVVSRGMGAAWLVEKYGCGFTYAPGNAEELAQILGFVAKDRSILASLGPVVARMSEEWTPAERAKVFLSHALDATP